MDFLRKFVFHNFALKLLALASAALLWSAVARQPAVEIAHTVPIEFIHVPADLAITTETLPVVQIMIRGPERLVRQVNSADLHPTVDLIGTRIGSGERTFELTAGQIHAPRGVEIVQVIPAQIHLGFDQRASREAVVHPRVTGSLPDGLQIAQITADPSVASIVGPKKHVDAVEAILTDPVDASGVIGTATFTVNAYVTDPLVRVSGPAQVRVTVTTEKASPSSGAKK